MGPRFDPLILVIKIEGQDIEQQLLDVASITNRHETDMKHQPLIWACHCSMGSPAGSAEVSGAA